MKIDSDIPLVHFVLTTLKNLDMVWTVWKDVLVHGREIVEHGKMYKTTSVYKWTQMDVFKWTSKSVVRSNHNGFTLYDNCVSVRVYSEHSCIYMAVQCTHYTHWLEWHIMNFKLFTNNNNKNAKWVFRSFHTGSRCCRYAVQIMFALSIQ